MNGDRHIKTSYEYAEILDAALREIAAITEQTQKRPYTALSLIQAIALAALWKTRDAL